MKKHVLLNIKEVEDYLLRMAMEASIFIWGAPGIGKSTVVEGFAAQLGLPCVVMLGSQMLPEDIQGAPNILNGATYFNPPAILKKDVPYCLFIDELNIAREEVQKAFYSLILDRRIGDYTLPEGSMVIGAGNYATNSALVSPMPSTLMGRMIHLNMYANHRLWLEWAKEEDLHPWVTNFIEANKNCLVTDEPPMDEPYSSPRSWEKLSKAIKEYEKSGGENFLKASMYGTISSNHVPLFESYIKRIKENITIESIIKGKSNWPSEVSNRDLLLVLVNDFKNLLKKSLPEDNSSLSSSQKKSIADYKNVLNNLLKIEPELVNTLIVEDNQEDSLPDWFILEINELITN